jgi:hypothetical protein
VATLVIASGADADKATLTMAGGQATEVTMAGDGSMQEQNAGTGNLSVVLTPVWMNVAQTSQSDGQAVTNYLIGAAFTGTINGAKVAGNINKLPIPDTSDTSPSTAEKIKKYLQNTVNGFSMSTLFQVGGLLTSVGMLYYMAKEKKETNTQKKNDSQKDGDTKDDVAKKEQQIDEDYQSKDVSDVSTQVQTVEVIGALPGTGELALPGEHGRPAGQRARAASGCARWPAGRPCSPGKASSPVPGKAPITSTVWLRAPSRPPMPRPWWPRSSSPPAPTPTRPRLRWPAAKPRK